MALTKRQKEHRKFISSPEWKAIKENLFHVRGKECEVCGNKNVQVHHKHYNKPYGEEKPEDIIILCGKHHRKAHGLIKETDKEKEIRELHEEMWNVPSCYRMEYENNPKRRLIKKKNRKNKKSKSEIVKKEFKPKVILRKNKY